MLQKFLLVLAAVIVGAAVVAGLQKAQQSLEQAQQFELTQDLLKLVIRAQTWYRASAQIGGGNGSFEKITFAAINFDSLRTNHTFVLTKRQARSFCVAITDPNGGQFQMQVEIFSDSISSFRKCVEK